MTTPQQIEQAIAKTKDEKSFIRELLQGALNWPVPESLETLEDISYDWSKEELRAKGLDEQLVAGTVKQIRLADHQPWGIFLLEFKNPDVFTTGRGLAGPLRAVLRGLVPSRRQAGNLPSFGRENLLFICTHAYKHYRFAYFKAPVDGEKTAPLAAFGWSPGEPCRTACELNLPDLAWPETPAAWVANWADAFSVEKVTKAFFEQYRTVFEKVEGLIKGAPSKDLLRLFTQRLFNRLMFIAFIQKKGWLRIDAMEHNDYLEGLWQSYQRAAGALTGSESAAGNENFYNLRLRQLFFSALNTPNDVNRVALGTGQHAPKGLIQRLIGDVPYLNGGLFEKSDDGSDESLGINVPDKAIDAILHELFGRFNFTVAESTPLDIEVAVDPEMLGKVFEELVTGRHESGSYYTPKPIVSFMCREALKGYLETKSPQDSAEAIAALVDDHNPAQLANGEAVLDALRKVRVCDPACGSGAYLLGMMHELLDLRASLFRSDKKLDAKTVYERKLEIIQTNVYGVDIDPFATNTAMLRLWLSLAVEADEPEPLPNLDFKIGTGDSLGAPDPSGGGQLALHRTLVDKYLDLKREYLRAHSQRKKDLKREIIDLKSRLKQWAHAQGDVNGFDWTVEFAEVFVGEEIRATIDAKFAFMVDARPQLELSVATGATRGGFDIVLANPPYVRQELIRDLKPNLKRVFGEAYCGTADLYVFFYMRALQLLAPQGMLAFISSNKWFRAGYGQKLRALFANDSSVRLILDFHDLPVFESAIAYPMIFIAAKKPPNDSHAPVLAEPLSLEVPYPNVTAVVSKFGHRLPRTALGRDGTWHLASSSAADRLKKMRAAGPVLGTIVGDRFFRGVVTGLNDAFYIDERLADEWRSRSEVYAKFVKRAIRGEHTRRYSINDAGIFLLRIPNGFTISLLGHDLSQLSHRERASIAENQGGKAWKIFNDYVPEIARHLAKFQKSASERDDQGDFWWELRPCDYYSIFEGSKIVFPQTGKEGRFTLDTFGFDLDQTVYTIATSDLFLLAVLNSNSVETFLKETTALARGQYLRFLTQYLKMVPIPTVSAVGHSEVAALAQKCLDAKGQNCEVWEKEIDERVAALYGL